MKRKERDDGARPKAAKRLAGKATSRNRSAAAAARSVGTEDGIEARLPDETAAGGLGGTRGGDKPKAIPGEKNVGGMNTKKKKKKAEKVAKASGGEVPAVVGQIGQVDQHSSSMKRELGGSPKPKEKKLKHGALQPDKQEDDDHCETPAEAYQHLAPVLDLVCRELGVAGREKLRIYDPYFCAGSMREHLGALGFRNVHNRPDNFYHVVETGCIPAFDVLITNPPYSGNHVSELLRIVVKLAKPFFLLMPNWVYTKEYFDRELSRGSCATFFLYPWDSAKSRPVRYRYQAPPQRRKDANAGARRNSPFPSLWYCSMGAAAATRQLLSKCTASLAGGGCGVALRAAGKTRELAREVMSDQDPRRKRLRKNQRDARKRKAAASMPGQPQRSTGNHRGT